MLGILLKGKWFVVPDFSYKMNQIAWILFGIAFIGCIIIMLWWTLQRPLSRFRKIKQAYVEVVYVPKSILERSVIGVYFIDPKKEGEKDSI